MDQNVLTISDVLFLGVSVGTLTVTSTFSTPTINTGQGDNEVYAMVQDVETTSDVTFGTMTATVSVLLPDAGIIKIGEQQISRNNSIYLELNNGIIVDGYTLAKDETFFQDLAKFDSNLMIEKKYDVAPYYLNFALKDTIGIESKVKLQNLSDISLQNKAGTGQIEIIERDTLFTSEVVANLSNIGTITVYDSVTTWKGIKSFEEYAEMADGGTMTLTASTAGVIEIYGETSGVGDTIYASAHFSSDAAVSKHLDCTLNVADTDVASKFCIYDSGSAVVIKNALGRNGQFYIRVKYFTPSFP